MKGERFVFNVSQKHQVPKGMLSLVIFVASNVGEHMRVLAWSVTRFSNLLWSNVSVKNIKSFPCLVIRRKHYPLNAVSCNLKAKIAWLGILGCFISTPYPSLPKFWYGDVLFAPKRHSSIKYISLEVRCKTRIWANPYFFLLPVKQRSLSRRFVPCASRYGYVPHPPFLFEKVGMGERRNFLP